MVHEVQMGKRTRMSFSRIDEVLDMPDLIEVQKNSYQRFIDEDLREVLADISPITDYSEKLVLEFVDYKVDMEHPKYEVDECKERDVNYCAPLKVVARLINKETGEVKQQEVFMGDFPLMTEQGTFIINGAERVIVSQLVRSPGVYFSRTIDKVGKNLFATQVIPNRGAWLEYETDSNEILWVKIDRQRKIYITALLRALGYGSNAEIIELLGEDERLLATLSKDNTASVEDGLIEIYKRQRPGEPPTEEGARSLLNSLFFDKRYDLARVGRYKFNKKLSLAARIVHQVLADDVIAPLTGEILGSAGEVISREAAIAIENAGVPHVFLAFEDKRVKVLGNNFVPAEEYLPFDPMEVGLNEKVHFPTLCELMKQGEGMSEEDYRELLAEHVHDLIPRHIIKDDIVASISYLIGMPYGIGKTDDIDHLGNRRIRSVGELLQNQIRVGLTRLERVVRERMSIQDMDVVMPSNLINIRPVTAAIKEFFGSSQLSQFMDQNNPLAELTHKRRLSALGPGGLNRERATFDVRDVHFSHYGRMCPIETPEGPNIGLINSLSTYARINEYGFIEAPYRKVDKTSGQVTDEIVYMTADEEDNYNVGQAKEPLNEDGTFQNDRVIVRWRDETIEVPAENVDYIDVSPKQVVSVATAMIPFLENDDANRALMGSNMQRQAVPLLVPEAPIVGTGMEYKAGHDSGVVILSKHAGTVHFVDAEQVVIKDDEGELHQYKLTKFARSNQGTCINQRPRVKAGQIIEKGDLLADGPSTEKGEIGLGRNVLIGFMTW
ncbi:MAG: DNA-directed RNA polymerase subunit beta, partial [Clostridia bacterium]|nr:DNA-directed RNA polymerase subunit beta [Clostridia bacterium]